MRLIISDCFVPRNDEHLGRLAHLVRHCEALLRDMCVGCRGNLILRSGNEYVYQKADCFIPRNDEHLKRFALFNRHCEALRGY